MPDANDIMNNFMTKKNRELLGETVESDDTKNDNFDPGIEKVKNTFSGEEISTRDDRSMLLIRRILNALIIIPLLMTCLLGFFYLLLKIMPNILVVIKKFLLLFF